MLSLKYERNLSEHLFLKYALHLLLTCSEKWSNQPDQRWTESSNKNSETWICSMAAEPLRLGKSTQHLDMKTKIARSVSYLPYNDMVCSLNLHLWWTLQLRGGRDPARLPAGRYPVARYSYHWSRRACEYRRGWRTIPGASYSDPVAWCIPLNSQTWWSQWIRHNITVISIDNYGDTLTEPEYLEGSYFMLWKIHQVQSPKAIYPSVADTSFPAGKDHILKNKSFIDQLSQMYQQPTTYKAAHWQKCHTSITPQQHYNCERQQNMRWQAKHLGSPWQGINYRVVAGDGSGSGAWNP